LDKGRSLLEAFEPGFDVGELAPPPVVRSAEVDIAEHRSERQMREVDRLGERVVVRLVPVR
jgi:hypothetical protein